MDHIQTSILGDPGAVSVVGRKGRMKVFEYGRKSLWIPTVTASKNSSGCRLLIGHNKCCVLLCPIGELFLLSSSREFVHNGYCSITARPAHPPKKCTQSGNFPFDIKSPTDFKILSARLLKTLFQKCKLELRTGIHACMGHVLRKY